VGWGSKQAYHIIHQPISMVSQCSLIAWLNGLASGDQHQLTGSGSALEACLQWCAIQMAAFTLLLLYLLKEKKSLVMRNLGEGQIICVDIWQLPEQHSILRTYLEIWCKDVWCFKSIFVLVKQIRQPVAWCYHLTNFDGMIPKPVCLSILYFSWLIGYHHLFWLWKRGP